jgi:hypothetical protein
MCAVCLEGWTCPLAYEREYSHRAPNTAVRQLGWHPPNRPHAIMLGVMLANAVPQPIVIALLLG